MHPTPAGPAPAPARPAGPTSDPGEAAGRVRWLGEAIGAAAVVAAAASSGVLDDLDDPDGARPTVSELAASAGLHPAMTDRLVAALAALGLVEVEGLRVRATPELGPVLVQHHMWSALARALRTGTGSLDVARRDGAAALYPQAVAYLERLHRPDLADEVARRLDGSGPSVLDLGAGAAPWTRALARRDPAVRVTAVDLPEVCPALRAAVAADGVADRFTVVAGDAFEVPLGTGFDLVVLAGVCRLFPPDRAEHLVRRAVAALRPGGALAILDALPDTDRADGSSNALYALGLSLRTASGGIHDLATFTRWCAAAGLPAPAVHLLDDPLVTLLTTTRPG